MKHLIPISILLIGLLGSCTLPEHYQDPQIWDRPRTEYRIIFSTVSQPHVGNNLLQVRLTDTHGRPITDVTVTFYLRMADMGFMMYQVCKGKMIQPGLYQAEANINMGGDWNITAEIERPDFPEIREDFAVSAGTM